MSSLINILAVLIIAIFMCSCNRDAGVESWSNKKAMIKALEWQEGNPIFSTSPTDWTNGAYYTGVCRAHEVTNNDIYLEALVGMAKRNDWKPSDRFYHADDLSICSSYLYLETLNIEEVELEATTKIILEHLEKAHKWKEGNINTNQPVLWWWCDALFMVPPVITQYANYVNDYSYLDKMHNYFVETYDILFDKEEKLFARDLRYVWNGDDSDRREKNGEKVFWSRGNGWVLGGLAIILDDMPKTYKNRAFYVDLYKTMSKRILEIQGEDGLWRTSLLSPESYPHGEVSGSGFYTFALAWGINNGVLDKVIYEPAVENAWMALRNCQNKNGMVGWVQDIGDSPKPVSSDSWQNYGTGAFLLAGSEMVKMENDKYANH